MSLYQKYRPRRFEDVQTQDHVIDTLKAAIKNNSFGHAYIFVGTRGTGKTSIARIFARAVNCSREEFVKEHGEPCNECDSCLLSLNGSNIDIIEMDAASNRGIDEVRNLKEGVDFLPSIGKYKVYIIDEAHMMTKEAFNALLKTIEEPPAHAVFIMCTTEIFKLPPTILSRSQVFELRHASLDQIIRKIDLILKSEDKSIDNTGKEIIARLGKGSFRDTESILEKVISSFNSGEEVTSEQIISALGLSSFILLDKAKLLFYERNIKKLREFIDDEVDENTITNFNHQLAESVYEDIKKDLGENKVDLLKIDLFDFLTSLDKEVRNSTNPRIVYIAKVLKFMKLSSGLQNTTQGSINSEQSKTGMERRRIEDGNKIDHEIDTAVSKPPGNNPSALLRHRKQTEQREIQQKEVQAEKSKESKPKFISKLDFLDFVKSNNSFLFRFFSHHEFQILGNDLIVDVSKQMEKDLLMKPQTIMLIKAFGDKYGIELKVTFGEVQVDKRLKEEKQVIEIQKKIEDLSDSEIKEIFNVE